MRRILTNIIQRSATNIDQGQSNIVIYFRPIHRVAADMDTIKPIVLSGEVEEYNVLNVRPIARNAI